MADLKHHDLMLFHCYKIYHTALLFYKVKLKRFQVLFGEDSFANFWIMHIAVIEVEGDRLSTSPMTMEEREDRAKALLEKESQKEEVSQALRHIERSENEWQRLKEIVRKSREDREAATSQRSRTEEQVNTSQNRYKISGYYCQPRLVYRPKDDPTLAYEFIKDLKEKVEHVSQIRFIDRAVQDDKPKYVEDLPNHHIEKNLFTNSKNAKDSRKIQPGTFRFPQKPISASDKSKSRMLVLAESIMKEESTSLDYQLEEKRVKKSPAYEDGHFRQVRSRRASPGVSPDLWVVSKKFQADAFKNLRMRHFDKQTRANSFADRFIAVKSVKSDSTRIDRSFDVTSKAKPKVDKQRGVIDVTAKIPLEDAGLRISSKTRKTLYCLTKQIEGRVFMLNKKEEQVIFKEAVSPTK